MSQQNERAIASGGCFCGEVRYVINDAPRVTCICHCNSCRKASGGAMVAWATFANEALQICKGALTVRDTPNGVSRSHCPRCGTSLTYRHAQRPGEVDLTLASLDRPGQFAPTMHIWIEDKPAWLIIADGLPQHPRTAG